ncbi:S9 family peptidase [Sphingomonas sp. KC8]|uniref:S9 family peptidase n=1 Tax=Sphingomonas sp. KC8 TaxID=1030157 RepID=UPI0002488F38|nr:alpha/beta fold hydrolase [Sphingomonas sp. KC8]ARS29017.1 peptidase S9 [Sphingomonas sp. KC8]
MLRYSLLVGSSLFACASAFAQTMSPEAAFGARESVVGASLSPNGARVAFLAPGKGQGNILFTVPIDGSTPAVQALAAGGDPERLTDCDWVSDRRLVCNVFAVHPGVGEAIGVSRIVAVNIDGSELKLVSRRQSMDALYFNRFGGAVIDWLPGQDGAILFGRAYVPDAMVGKRIGNRQEGYGVDRVDTLTLESKRVVPPIRDAIEFISDGSGNIRLKGVAEYKGDGYTTGVTRYAYRQVDSEDWRGFGEYDAIKQEGLNPYAVDPVENVAYGFMKKDGRQALFKRFLDGTLRDELVFSRPDVDVDGLIRLGRKGRIVGLSFATDRRNAIYFDEPLRRLGEGLAKALPDQPLINFESESADGQKLLVWAGSDVDPGSYFIFDRGTKQLRPLMYSRPELVGYKLAPVRSINVRASDGTMIPGYLTLPVGSSGKGLPTIVMPHGGPGSRDEWGFDWLAQYYAHRGYAVLQPNFRGSTGYGDAWFKNNGFQSWRIAIGDVVDSGRWLISEGIADPKKLAILGWSYGGYAALQSGVVAPDLYKAIVAIAPVTDLNDLKEQYRNTSAFVEVQRFVGSGPHIREGSPAQHAAAIHAPVMLFHGELDRNVDVRASKLMASKLTDAGKGPQVILYPGLDHYLEDSAVRADLLGKSDAFLKKSMGM